MLILCKNAGGSGRRYATALCKGNERRALRADPEVRLAILRNSRECQNTLHCEQFNYGYPSLTPGH
jgi:hypothetical protein